MLAITPIRTKRINATLSELSIRNAIYLCKLPKKQRERGTTELLNRIVDAVDKPLTNQIVLPKMWTFQEREFVVAHYMAHVIDGGPDFAIGKNGHYSDYIADLPDSCPQSVEMGHLSGQTWYLRPLLGGYLESIERLIFSGELPDDREGWIIGAMACQTYCEDDEEFDLENAMDADIDEHVAMLALKLLDLKESEFLELMNLYVEKLGLIDHLFNIYIGDSGLVLLPADKEVPDLPPARFCFSLAVRESTDRIFGGFEGGSNGADDVLQSAANEHHGASIVSSEGDIRQQNIRFLEESQGA